MATAKLTPKSLARTIRHNLALKPRRHQWGCVVLDTCCRRAQLGELPFEVYHAAYGLAEALARGVLHGRLHVAVERMAGYDMAALVAAVTCGTTCIGDVSRWLIENQDVIITS